MKNSTDVYEALSGLQVERLSAGQSRKLWRGLDALNDMYEARKPINRLKRLWHALKGLMK